MNDDGVPDLIVGEPERTVPGMGVPISRAGRIYVFSGSTGELFFSMDGSNANDEFGYAVAGVGDLNLDGFDDLAVGIPGNDGGANNAGGVQLIFMNSDPSMITAAPVRAGTTAGERYGAAVAGVGNIDPVVDPFPDVAVGAPGDASSATINGRVEVINWYNPVAILNVSGTQAGAEFGFSVAGIADISGDGNPDLLIGEPARDIGGRTDVGTVYAVRSNNGSTIFSRNGRAQTGIDPFTSLA